MATTTVFAETFDGPNLLTGVATVDNGEAATLTIPCRGRAVVRIGVPTITAGTLTFTVQPYAGATFRTLKDAAGNTVTIPSSTGDMVINVPGLSGAHAFTIVCGASQGAARSFQVQCVGASPSPFDLAALMTGGTFSGQVLFPAGAVATPSIKFTPINGDNVGLYHTESNILFAINGARRMSLSFNGLSMPSTSADIRDSNASDAEMLRLRGVASAVNEITLTNAATTAYPIISATGSDTDIGIDLQPKGAGVIRLGNNLANYVQAVGAAAASAPALTARGSDTDVDLSLSGKGTGLVRFGTRTASGDVAVTGYIEIKDAGGTIRRLAVVG